MTNQEARDLKIQKELDYALSRKMDYSNKMKHLEQKFPAEVSMLLGDYVFKAPFWTEYYSQHLIIEELHKVPIRGAPVYVLVSSNPPSAPRVKND